MAVEGRYDAHAVRAVVDTLVVELGGFSAIRDRQRRQLLRELAAERGLILLTDSDAAGFLIRSRLRDAIRSGTVRMAYVPAIRGKERRKDKPGKEGLLGVEGMTADVICRAILDAGTHVIDDTVPDPDAGPEFHPVTRGELYEQGFFGREGSADLRAALLAHLRLPPHTSVNALVEMLAMPAYNERYRDFLKNNEGKTEQNCQKATSEKKEKSGEKSPL